MPKNISNTYCTQIVTDLTSKQRNYISIAIGTKDGKDVFIVDQNNNRDLTDDAIHVIKPINWHSAENSVKCRYQISNGQKMVQDSTWLVHKYLILKCPALFNSNYNNYLTPTAKQQT